MIAARTRGAGTKALDDNRAMLENEALRIKQFEEKKVSRGAEGRGVRKGRKVSRGAEGVREAEEYDVREILRVW